MKVGATLTGAMALGTQVSGALLMLVGLAFWPPAHGRMLLVPITAAAQDRLAATAIDRGGTIVARGKFPGSIVIEGDRAAVTRGLIGRGVITIAAPELVCGTKSA